MVFKRIQHLRTSSTLSQDRIARSIGVPLRLYSKYESGIVGIPVEVLVALA